MTYDKNTLFPYLIYNMPFPYSNHITVHPVTMNDIVLFQFLSPSIMVRKDSIFPRKDIIKMPYLTFLLQCFKDPSLELESKITGLSEYYLHAVKLLGLCCKNAEIKFTSSMQLILNGEMITPQIFDDLRRIILLQNDIDFDIDAFLNKDTEQRLKKAREDQQKHSQKASIEDYIDSLVIAMNTTEERIQNMTIRKFWRYVKRYQLYENYTFAKTGEYSGMVSFKEPIPHWMASLDETDAYDQLKADENSLKGKLQNANN